MSAKYEKLAVAVDYFLDANNKSIGDRDKAWILAFRGLEFIGFNVASEPKTIAIPVDANLTAKLPSDYVSWGKIGLLNSAGEVQPLKINPNLSLYKSNSSTRISDNSADITDIWDQYFVNFFYNGIYTHLPIIGLGSQPYGECRVDEKAGVIVLDPNFQYSRIILEYVSAPEMDNDYSYLRLYRESIIAWLEWKFKIENEQHFYGRLTECRRMESPVKQQVLENLANSLAGAKITW